MSTDQIAHDHAIDSSIDYLKAAVREIDAKFGDGFARANPALVASFIDSCSREFAAMRQRSDR